MTRRSGSSQNLGCYCSYKLRVIFFVLFNLMIMKLYSNYRVFFLFCISILLLFFQTLFLVCLCKKIVHMYFFVTILSDFIFYFWYVPVKKFFFHICIFVICCYSFILYFLFLVCLCKKKFLMYL